MTVIDQREQREKELTAALASGDLTAAGEIAGRAPAPEVVGLLGRRPSSQQAVIFRLLHKDQALEVFEAMTGPAQARLVERLGEQEVGAVFADMDPDDRVRLLDELPALVARRLLQDLPDDEMGLTSLVLGYPEGSVGRRMSPEVVAVRAAESAGEALVRVRERLHEAETVYTLPVVDDTRRVVGVVSLRDLLASDKNTVVSKLAGRSDLALATEPVETAARRCAATRRLALPVVDSEDRLVGILTVDDALAVLEDAASEDQARQGGSEPLRQPYLSASLRGIVRSRLVWLLVLAIGATLTVQVLEVFEATLSEMVVLSVFIPLLIGTGGNTGNQAATTVTRALALGDVRPRDVPRIVARELAVGSMLGVVLGGLGFVIVSLVYGWGVGVVIGTTLFAVCALAATVGGAVPVAASLLRADPAVFSNPFISTFLDATGLIVYFLIAKAVLGL